MTDTAHLPPKADTPARKLSAVYPLPPVETLPATGTTVVYALRDEDRRALYVGSTSQLHRRLEKHRYTPWGPSTRTVTWCRVPDRQRLDREHEVITRVQPAFNVVSRDAVLRRRRRWDRRPPDGFYERCIHAWDTWIDDIIAGRPTFNEVALLRITVP